MEHRKEIDFYVHMLSVLGQFRKLVDDFFFEGTTSFKHKPYLQKL